MRNLIFIKLTELLNLVRNSISSTITNISLSKFDEIRALIFFLIVIGSVVLSKYIFSSHPYNVYFLFCLGCIIFSIALVLLCFLIFIVLSDNLYRPTAPQYPWNFWIDRFIPITFLFTPTLVILLFNPFESWFSAFILLLIIHVIIITPILKKWSVLRRWKISFEEIPEFSWRHPRLYEHISIALLYPLIWGIYFSLSRYLNLGQKIDITHNILFTLDWLTLLVFLSPSLFFWWMLFKEFLNNLRNYLWEEFLSLITSIHKSLLSKNIYFIFIKKLHRFAFILNMLFSYNSEVCENFPRWNKVLSFFGRPLIIPSIILILVLFEIFYTHGIMYYSMYLLFFYPLFKGIWFCITQFTWHRFAYDVCFADFLTGNWTNPKYPYQFWDYVSDSEFYFGVKIDTDTEAVISQMSLPYIWKSRKVIKSRHTSELRLRVVGIRSFLDLSTCEFIYKRTGNCRGICIQLAANYYAIQGVRWTHTAAVSRPLHSATAFFIKDPLDFIALINTGWSHYSIIEKSSKGLQWPTPHSMYQSPLPEAIPVNPKTFAEVVETNLAVTIRPVFSKVGTFPEMRQRYPTLSLEINQPRTDVVIYMSGVNGPFLLGIDQKAVRNPGIGRNEAFSSISEKRYASTLDEFWIHYRKTHSATSTLRNCLNELKISSSNFDLHRETWSSSLDKFDPNWRPPLRLIYNFQPQGLLEGVQASLVHSEKRIVAISDRLYALKIPPANNGSYVGPDNIFQDSYIQKILSE